MTSTESERRDRSGDRRALRRLFRSKRRQLPAAVEAAHAEAVARHFFASGLQLKGRTFALYCSNDADGELSTAPLLARLLLTRKRLALPVVGRAGTMQFHRYRRTTRLVPNRFGILEPAPGAIVVSPLAIDLLVMPLVAFDERGVRLGMGAGYYDRFLGRLPAAMRPLLVGLAHGIQQSATPLPCASWDVPLDGVLTEAGWQTFK